LWTQSVVLSIIISRLSRYCFKAGLCSAIVDIAEEQARRSFDAIALHKSGERRRQKLFDSALLASPQIQTNFRQVQTT
jgi:hypothetical protein